VALKRIKKEAPVLAAFGAILAAFFTGWNAFTTKGTYDIIKRNSVAEYRPYVYVSVGDVQVGPAGVRVDREPNYEACTLTFRGPVLARLDVGRIEVVNLGKGPAKDVQFGAYVTLTSSPQMQTWRNAASLWTSLPPQAECGPEGTAYTDSSARLRIPTDSVVVYLHTFARYADVIGVWRYTERVYKGTHKIIPSGVQPVTVTFDRVYIE
jgi:hypothetical protein